MKNCQLGKTFFSFNYLNNLINTMNAHNDSISNTDKRKHINSLCQKTNKREKNYENSVYFTGEQLVTLSGGWIKMNNLS